MSIKLKALNKLEQAVSEMNPAAKELEKEVSDYHSLKLSELNKMINEMWRRVYHGSDIAGFEVEAREFPDFSKKKKTYEYSMVMLKGPNKVRMDMKRRCSMGQKVLVSTIMRLALI